MSVIVKGMEMPDNCHVCGLCYGGWCYAMPAEIDEMCPDEDRPAWCPLRPLPEKHGRLIDADRLDNSLGIEDSDIDMHFRLMECETIVEAEGDDG